MLVLRARARAGGYGPLKGPTPHYSGCPVLAGPASDDPFMPTQRHPGDTFTEQDYQASFVHSLPPALPDDEAPKRSAMLRICWFFRSKYSRHNVPVLGAVLSRSMGFQ